MRILLEGSLFGLPAVMWVSFLLDLAIKSVVLGAALHLLARSMAGRSGRQQGRFWTLAFGLLLGVTILAAGGATSASLNPLSYLGLNDPVMRLIQADQDWTKSTQPAGRPVAERHEVRSPAAAAEARLTAGGTDVSAGITSRHWPILTALWLLGVAWFSAKSLWRYLRGVLTSHASKLTVHGPLAQCARHIQRTMGISNRPLLRLNASIAVSFVIGKILPKLPHP